MAFRTWGIHWKSDSPCPNFAQFCYFAQILSEQYPPPQTHHLPRRCALEMPIFFPRRCAPEIHMFVWPSAVQVLAPWGDGPKLPALGPCCSSAPQLNKIQAKGERFLRERGGAAPFVFPRLFAAWLFSPPTPSPMLCGVDTRKLHAGIFCARPHPQHPAPPGKHRFWKVLPP